MENYTQIQCTFINPGNPFVFNSNPNHAIDNYALAPFISSKLYQSTANVKTLKIRATVYIDSNFTGQPGIQSVTETGSILNIIFDYSYTEELPSAYNVWYLEIDYVSSTVGNIIDVVTKLSNTDPELSRGTVTTVQQA